jgi:arginine/lysine/ornithine decarboxylase
MDHSQALVLDALAAYHRWGEVPFTPPGHKRGRGADPGVLAVLGEEVSRSDVLATAGLDDRRSSGLVQRAGQLMADAVGAEQTFPRRVAAPCRVKADAADTALGSVGVMT